MNAIIKGEQTKDLLNNPILKDALANMEAYLEAQALSCDPDDGNKAHRVVLAKQIWRGLRREFERLIENGNIERLRIDEIERRKGLKKFMR